MYPSSVSTSTSSSASIYEQWISLFHIILISREWVTLYHYQVSTFYGSHIIFYIKVSFYCSAEDCQSLDKWLGIYIWVKLISWDGVDSELSVDTILRVLLIPSIHSSNHHWKPLFFLCICFLFFSIPVSSSGNVVTSSVVIVASVIVFVVPQSKIPNKFSG